VTFTAPVTPGVYHVRLNAVEDFDWPNSYYTSYHYQPSLGRDTAMSIISKAVDQPYGIGTIIVPEEALAATVDLHPDTLNLKSQGQWVTAYIELSEGDVNDIDISTILLNETIPSELHPTEVGDYDDDGVPDLMVKIERAAVIAYISNSVNMTQLAEDRSMTIALQVSGELTNGTSLHGSDTITILYTRRGIGIGQILFAR